MKIVRILGKCIHYVFYILKFRSPFLAFAFSHNNLSLKIASEIKRKGKVLHFSRNSKNTFPISGLKFYNTPQLNYLANLLNNKDVEFISEKDGALMFKIGEIIYPVSSYSNLSILNELITDHYYNISTPENCILIDIGMNVGYASLYFSQFKNISKIYSFEPFEDTYLIAKKNFEINGQFGRKISPFNYGISNYSGNIDVPLLEGGSVIASTEESFIKNHKISSSKTIQVKVRDILELLEEISKNHVNQAIALKIDCEGEEYNILKKIDENKSFENIIFLCIEWHFKGPHIIHEILSRNGYIVFDMPKNEDGEFGMIYGFKNK